MSGAALHEPKGIAAAVADRAYISNGAGSGSWIKVPIAALESTAQAFQNSLIHVRDQKNQGINGGTFSTGDWRTRDFTTVLTNEITGASLVGNQIRLPAGTYYCECSAPAFRVSRHKTRLFNDNDNTVVLTGSTEFVDESASYAQTRSIVKGRFTLAATKDLELQHRCASSQGTNGFGLASSFATEVYAEALFWKIG